MLVLVAASVSLNARIKGLAGDSLSSRFKGLVGDFRLVDFVHQSTLGSRAV